MTARTLWLLRHAEAREGSPSDDHDRPLTTHGGSTARALGAHLARAAARPTLVLCSSARRARETLEPLVAALPQARPEVERALYLATDADLLARLLRLDAAEHHVLLLAHNPGLHALACDLVGAGDPALVERMRRGFPACACARIECDGAWTDLGAGSARLADFTTPRDIRQTRGG